MSTPNVYGLGVTLLCFINGFASADVTFDWATIGDPGNVDDVHSEGCGGVDYAYRISKHEVTNEQYVEFLNAVATTDTNHIYLYHEIPERHGFGGIFREGDGGSFEYYVKPGQGDNPVTSVSFINAMRFVNWLENGQPTPTGMQGAGTTEDGSYTIENGVTEIREASAEFVIPNHDEWYKAAYYDPNRGRYFDYPTSSNSKPTSEPPTGGFNSANYYDDTTGFAITGENLYDPDENYLNDVGAYARSASPYGTFDQGGNAMEWIETVVRRGMRGIRGGAWGSLFLDEIHLGGFALDNMDAVAVVSSATPNAEAHDSNAVDLLPTNAETFGRYLREVGVRKYSTKQESLYRSK